MSAHTLLSVIVLLFGLCVTTIHADSSNKITATGSPQSAYRYTAAELAEEAIEAYQALGTNNVASAKEILLNAIINYIEDNERGGSSVTYTTKIVQKETQVRERFTKIYSEMIKPQQQNIEQGAGVVREPRSGARVPQP